MKISAEVDAANARLCQVYKRFLDQPRLDGTLATRCAAPFLTAVTAKWLSSQRRILLVGQESLGWDFSPANCVDWPYSPVGTYADFFSIENNAEAMMHGYQAFSFAEHQPMNYRGAFWRAFRLFNASEDTAALTTNLFRFSVDEGSVIDNATQAEQAAILDATRGLLQAEIAELAPDAVVFLTGPRYDAALAHTFPDITYEALPGFTERQFSQVTAAGLPVESFRTYHPSYLNRHDHLWAGLEQLVERLTASKKMAA